MLGRPHVRRDGPAKVGGVARYAYEHQPPGGRVAYGRLVCAAMGQGTIDLLDTAEAERAPGVLLMMMHRNTPRQNPSTRGAPQLQGRRSAGRAGGGAGGG